MGNIIEICSVHSLTGSTRDSGNGGVDGTGAHQSVMCPLAPLLCLSQLFFTGPHFFLVSFVHYLLLTKPICSDVVRHCQAEDSPFHSYRMGERGQQASLTRAGYGAVLYYGNDRVRDHCAVHQLRLQIKRCILRGRIQLRDEAHGCSNRPGSVH